MIPFVQSKFERRPDDNYQTIDERCVVALGESWDIPGPVWEPCAPDGSGIAAAWPDRVICGSDAMTDPVPDDARSIITNTPYKTKVCNAMVTRLSGFVADGSLDVAAFLYRSQWDHAGGIRAKMLDEPPFAGLVRLRFRPWWSEDRDSSPIHSYQWVIFDRRHIGEPVVRYWPRSKAWRAA